MPTPDSPAVPCWGTPSVICWRRSSASPLCIDNIACCPTHPSFNHRRSSFSSRCCPTVEHSAAERHVGVVNICFQETFEDPSLKSFFPWISCSACAVFVISDTIIDLVILIIITISWQCEFNDVVACTVAETALCREVITRRLLRRPGRSSQPLRCPIWTVWGYFASDFYSLVDVIVCLVEGVGLIIALDWHIIVFVWHVCDKVCCLCLWFSITNLQL